MLTILSAYFLASYAYLILDELVVSDCAVEHVIT